MKTEVQTVGPDDTVQWASEKMTWADVGFLPVCDADRRVIGVITDRDIVVRVVAKGISPENARVGDCMTCEVVMCRPTDDLADGGTADGAAPDLAHRRRRRDAGR